MNVAIVGAGLFGCHIAIELARKGANVVIFEKKNGILLGASAKNQQRLHKGFHYPRAKQTTKEVLASVYKFEDRYRAAVGTVTRNHFGIARAGSVISKEQYLQHCREFGLRYSINSPSFLRREQFDLSILTDEHLLNIKKLTSIIKSRLRGLAVKVILNTPVTDIASLAGYDAVILTTYTRNNDFCPTKDIYQFEVCEKPVVRLPPEYRNISFVVMDGNFMCLDPFLGTPWHLFGGVCVGVHAMNVGHTPAIPPSLQDYVAHDGFIKNPKVTNFSKFISHGKTFFRNLDRAHHIGSFFQVKAVLPNVAATDERPTIIRKIGSKVINVFSGKLTHCIQAADEISTMLGL